MKKKVLLIIAPENFRDEEYFNTKKVLEDQGIDVTTVSNKLEEIRGMLGGVAKPDLTLDQVDLNQYDAIVFIGGAGAQFYFNNPKALELASEAYNKGKVVAAICIAPVILANAGILKGKKATVWDGEFVVKLESQGATYTGELVTKDGKIITGNGPQAAEEFANEIVKSLLK